MRVKPTEVTQVPELPLKPNPPSLPEPALVELELAEMRRVLAGVYGHTGISVSAPGLPDPFGDRPVVSCVLRLHTAAQGMLDGGVRCDAEAWPAQDDSINCVLLWRCAARGSGLQQILDEACRCLAPGGLLIACMANAFSPCQLGSGLPAVRTRQLSRWVMQAGAEPLQCSWLGPTWRGGGMREPSTRWHAQWRASFVLLARKQRSPLTPLRLDLRSRSRQAAFKPGMVGKAWRQPGHSRNDNTQES